MLRTFTSRSKLKFPFFFSHCTAHPNLWSLCPELLGCHFRIGLRTDGTEGRPCSCLPENRGHTSLQGTDFRSPDSGPGPAYKNARPGIPDNFAGCSEHIWFSALFGCRRPVASHRCSRSIWFQCLSLKCGWSQYRKMAKSFNRWLSRNSRKPGSLWWHWTRHIHQTLPQGYLQVPHRSTTVSRWHTCRECHNGTLKLGFNLQWKFFSMPPELFGEIRAFKKQLWNALYHDFRRIKTQRGYQWTTPIWSRVTKKYIANTPNLKYGTASSCIRVWVLLFFAKC